MRYGISLVLLSSQFYLTYIQHLRSMDNGGYEQTMEHV